MLRSAGMRPISRISDWKSSRAGVLARGGSGFTRDIFFHQRAAVIIGAGMQAELRQSAVQLDPGHLNIIDGARQHDPRQRVNLEMLGQGRAGPGDALLKQKGVLVDEAERHKFGEAAGLLWISRSSTSWLTQCVGVSTCPYISVEVLRMPHWCAVRITSFHCSVESLLRESTRRTSSSRISAAVPGSVSRPLSRSMAKIIAQAACR